MLENYIYTVHRTFEVNHTEVSQHSQGLNKSTRFFNLPSKLPTKPDFFRWLFIPLYNMVGEIESDTPK